MKYLHNLLLILFLLFGFLGLGNIQTSFGAYENQIFDESNQSKIKKLQEVFSGLGLYNGYINGEYNSIKDELIDFQIEAGIISSANDDEAGYFGNRTMSALEDKYGDKFLELKEEYLRLDEPSEDERYFYITAYYSPLPNQEKYSYNFYKGRYRTFQEEVFLQGDGVHTASGKPVFTGILAAPKNYPFGTKIYFEGLGVGVVEDRGGAIVNAGERGHEYDRIDVWMGYGDEGLERATKWGERKVKGKLVGDYRSVTIEFDSSPVYKYSDLKVDAENPSYENVIKLQSLLSSTGLYNGEIDGNYEKVKDILIDFQVENGVISSARSNEAGYFGKQTYAAFRKVFSSGIFVEKYESDGFGIPISPKRKVVLNKVKTKLTTLLNNKYKNSYLVYKKKTNIKNKLREYIDNTNNIKTKNELRYLVEIL